MSPWLHSGQTTMMVQGRHVKKTIQQNKAITVVQLMMSLYIASVSFARDLMSCVRCAHRRLLVNSSVSEYCAVCTVSESVFHTMRAPLRCIQYQVTKDYSNSLGIVGYWHMELAISTSQGISQATWPRYEPYYTHARIAAGLYGRCNRR